ncbi:hypothetical protein ACEPPN_009442 [Leptodophora sp. 'Broadleaf-Isolate-01']
MINIRAPRKFAQISSSGTTTEDSIAVLSALGLGEQSVQSSTPALHLGTFSQFREEQGIIIMSQSRIPRAVLALPILAFSLWTACVLHRNGINQSVAPFLEEIVGTKIIKLGSADIPILQRFFHVPGIDKNLKGIAVAFAPSTLGIDPVSWYQGLVFLTDYGLIYTIWLFESTRKANEGTLARYPLLFFMPAQIVTIGIMGPLYYYLSYISTPASKFLVPGNRTTNTVYIRGIFFTVALFFYLPHLGSFLHPSLTTRHAFNWSWQLFPLFVSLAQLVITTLPSSSTRIPKTTLGNSNTDIRTIRFTILPFAFLSASIWLYTLATSPHSLSTLFIPAAPVTNTFMPVMRRFLQVDQVSSFGASLLWLTYLFGDLKAEGVVGQNWLVLFAVKAVLMAVVGPGATFALGWLWREEVLAGGKGVEAKKRI